MKNTFWDKKMPTLFGLFFIIIAIVVTTFSIQDRLLYIGKASPNYSPENITTSNIAIDQVTISYVTESETTGIINFGETNQLGKLILDDRDKKSGNQKNYYIHYFSIKDLQPSKKYFFSILSNDKNYLNNGLFYETTTGSDINTNTGDTSFFASGKLLVQSGEPLNDGLIIIQPGNGQKFSILTDKNGAFTFTINRIYTEDMSSYLPFSDQISTKLTAYGKGAQADTTFDLLTETIIPPITLSNKYDFTLPQDNLTDEITTGVKNLSDLIADDTSSKKVPDITSPQNNQNFTDQQPTFEGNAKAKTQVKITINTPRKTQVEVITNSNGNWNYRPNNQIPPGNYYISISALDSDNIQKSVTRYFQIFPEGSQVDESATPSATPITIMTPGPTEIIIPTSIPSGEPTSYITKTPTPTDDQPGNNILFNISVFAIALIIISSMTYLIARKGAS